MGIPISFLGFLGDKDDFYDTEIGSNIRIARHALAVDELREDFEPTVWTPDAETPYSRGVFPSVDTVVSYRTPSGTGTAWCMVTPYCPSVSSDESTATNDV